MPEKQNIEWKAKWKDEYLEWICGFANAQGGKIYIGCNDNGEVIGVANAKKLMEDIPNKIRDAMGIIVDVNLLEKDGLEYIEINVPAYPVGISCKGVYYYRSGSTKQTLSGPALETFLLRRRGVSWDNMPFPSFQMKDVDDGEVDRFRKLAAKRGRIAPELLEEPKEVLMQKLHLVNNGYLTNAAMLLFAKDPQDWQQGAYIKIGYFENDADLLYQDEIHGSLLEQVDKALEVIYLKYMKAKISYEGIQRIERYFVPESALREALLNAVCHKQYESSIPVQVSVYEDRLYVANVGTLPETWTKDNLLGKHESRPYNPNVATVMYYAGFIESWGRGIEKICAACEADGLPAPEYTVHPGDIMLKFSAPEDRIVRVNDRVTDQVTSEVTDQLSEREKKVLSLLLEDPGYTMPQLADKIGVSRKTISLYLKALKERKLIERVGSARSGHWKVNQ
ncbi:MAG: ATP-binding protein [Anaerovoracaceae bacterium]|jgi:ATP-dependent DNA helicase RecG